jgi:hypothetical protein
MVKGLGFTIQGPGSELRLKVKSAGFRIEGLIPQNAQAGFKMESGGSSAG